MVGQGPLLDRVLRALVLSALVALAAATAYAEPNAPPPKPAKVETVDEWWDRMLSSLCDALMGGPGLGTYDKATGTCNPADRQ